MQENRADTEEVQDIQMEQSQPEELDIMSLSDEEVQKLEKNGWNFEQESNTIDSNFSGSEPQTESEPENPEQVSEQQESEPEEVEYTAEDWQRILTQPFKATGTNIQVKTPDEAVRLMQMGVGYNKKMEKLKHQRGMIEMLNNAGMTESDLQLLIDAKKGNKGALAKLMESTGTDTYDLPDLGEEPYTPTTDIVSAEQAEFISVANEVSKQPNGKEVLNYISETWDNGSFEQIVKQPDILFGLVQDSQTGLMQATLQTIEADRTLGRIPEDWLDKPFVELYDYVSGELRKQQQQVHNNPVVRESLPMGTQTQQTQIPSAAAIPNAAIEQTQPNVDMNKNVWDMSEAEFQAFLKATGG